jgi:ABC-2 type transport system permease protein
MAQETARVHIAPEAPLTPREARIQRAALILRWGAIINGVLAFLVVLAVTVAALAANPDLRALPGELLLARFTGTDELAVLALGLLLLANVSLLLVVMVGVQAQELWSVLLALFVMVGSLVALITQGYWPALVTIAAIVWAGALIVRDRGSFRANPVMLKEVRERMRGARAFVVISVYLALMSAFTVLLYLIQRGVVQEAASAVTGELGRVLFAGVIGIQLLLIIFIAPAFTAGAVSNERERKTYDLLQITLLPKPSFITGKLESALSYIVLLLLAAIPLQSIAFLFGGVSETELILAFVILAVTAVALGTVGLFFSTFVDRTLTASVRAYTVAVAVIVGIPLLLGFFINMYNSALVGTGTSFSGSPAAEAALIYIGALLVSLNPVTTAIATQQLLIDQQTIGFWTATLSTDGSSIPLVSPWISFAILYLMISAVLIVFSVRRMQQVDA